MAKLKNVKVNLTLPFIGSVEGTWEPDENERNAAWELYVELITRISVVELKPDEGLLREAISSLYSLFATTRDILKKYGASVARPKGENSISFGYLSVAILNTVLRPVLAKWHPLLLDYEGRKADNISAMEHEKNWERSEELRQALNDVRFVLIEYADLLAKVADVPLLVIER
jgi:hypothetical protein